MIAQLKKKSLQKEYTWGHRVYSSLLIIPNSLPQELELQEAIQRDPEYQTKLRIMRDAEDRSKGDSSFTKPSGAGTQVAAGGAPSQTPCKGYGGICSIPKVDLLPLDPAGEGQGKGNFRESQQKRGALHRERGTSILQSGHLAF